MKDMTAEEYLDNDLKGAHQIYDETGVTLINGIEHSEICRIMEAYHQAKLKELEALNADLFCDNFEADNINSSATKCKNCWGEKWQHNKFTPSLVEEENEVCERCNGFTQIEQGGDIVDCNVCKGTGEKELI